MIEYFISVFKVLQPGQTQENPDIESFDSVFKLLHSAWSDQGKPEIIATKRVF